MRWYHTVTRVFRAIAPGRSSRRHLVITQSWCKSLLVSMYGSTPSEYRVYISSSSNFPDSLDSLDFLNISPLVDPLVGIQCSHYVDEYKYLQFGQHRCVLKNFIYDFFPTSQASSVLFVLLRQFLKWEISGHIAPVLWGAVSRVYLKNYITSLYVDVIYRTYEH